MKSFNPRAREGRDKALLIFSLLIFVSIHAPARGATLWKIYLDQCF